MSLDRSHAAVQGESQRLHFRPAQPCFVVGMICQGCVGTDCLSRNTDLDQFGGFWYPRESGFSRHSFLPFRCAAVRFDDKIHQSGGVLPVKRSVPAAFSMPFSGVKRTGIQCLALEAEEPAPPGLLHFGFSLFLGYITLSNVFRVAYSGFSWLWWIINVSCWCFECRNPLCQL